MKRSFLNQALVQNQKGFSLIEILIALALLAIAGTFVAGKFTDSLNEGKVNAAKIQMSTFAERLNDFKRKCNFYPTSEQGLEALITKPSSGRECKDYPSSGFLQDQNIPKDPWDNDYVYESDGKTFNIYSYGGDGAQGGEDFDKDIYLKPASKSAPASNTDSAQPSSEKAAAQGTNEAAPQN